MIHASPLRRWAGGRGRCGVAVDAIADLALFVPLAAGDLERVAALARIDLLAAAEPVVEQWETSIDFYVILEGRVEVLVDGERVAELARGEFFGELAALDWGGGYGYPRVASVRTLQATTLLTFPGGSMNEIARDHPPIARQIRRVGLQRLTRNQR